MQALHLVNAVPPANFPHQVIIAQERWFSDQHPEATFWLRVDVGVGHVQHNNAPSSLSRGATSAEPPVTHLVQLTFEQ